eukprot:scaffold129231_cov14-Prasinocladus_malaysianus.AAC.1
MAARVYRPYTKKVDGTLDNPVDRGGRGAHQALVEVDVAVKGHEVDGGRLAQHGHEVAHHRKEQQGKHKVQDIPSDLSVGQQTEAKVRIKIKLDGSLTIP